jgi:hypothetical protein
VSDGKQQRTAELIELIESHPATLAENEWSSLRRMYTAKIRNAAALVALIELPQENIEIALHLIRADQPPEVMNEYFDELFRHLLNYTASVSALRDHARNLMHHYSTGNFRFEYENRIAQLASRDVVRFIQDLRNYLQHNRVPPLQIQFAITGEEVNNMDFSVRLDPQRLLQWDGWKSGSKSYLRDRDTLILSESVKEYTGANTELYQWLFSQFSSVHYKELEALEVLKAELRILLGYPGDGGMT